MHIAIDFDGTVVSSAHAYGDLDTPLQLLPGSKDGLRALKRAGHVLILYSARANRSLWEDPELNPLVRAGVVRINRSAWEKSKELHLARYRQMIDFANAELPGMFDAIDDGKQGKPMADLFLDDLAIRVGHGAAALIWPQVAAIYGEPDYGHRSETA